MKSLKELEQMRINPLLAAVDLMMRSLFGEPIQEENKMLGYNFKEKKENDCTAVKMFAALLDKHEKNIVESVIEMKEKDDKIDRLEEEQLALRLKIEELERISKLKKKK